MCGRYALRTSTPELAAILGVEPPEEVFPPRFNIAPSTIVPALRRHDSGTEVLAGLRWGLVPFWARDTKSSYSMINARSETIAKKPAFRAAFKSRRCVIPADGYYEWQRRDGAKQPWYITDADAGVLMFAGIWERWRGPDAQVVESCAIVTTAANDDVARIHDRMPVLLDPAHCRDWIDAAPDTAAALMAPASTGTLAAVAVSSYVNNARNEGERCVTPLTAE